jgi:hypothetical protein
VGAGFHTKAHFAIAENDAMRTFGSLWNETLVPGIVLGVETDTSGKRANVFLNVRWDLSGSQRVNRINVRSATAGELPSIEKPLRGRNRHPLSPYNRALSGRSTPPCSPKPTYFRQCGVGSVCENRLDGSGSDRIAGKIFGLSGPRKRSEGV